MSYLEESSGPSTRKSIVRKYDERYVQSSPKMSLIYPISGHSCPIWGKSWWQKYSAWTNWCIFGASFLFKKVHSPLCFSGTMFFSHFLWFSPNRTRVSGNGINQGHFWGRLNVHFIVPSGSYSPWLIKFYGWSAFLLGLLDWYKDWYMN